MVSLSITDTMPGVSFTGAGRSVAETATESRKVNGSSAGGAPSDGGSAGVRTPAAAAASSCCAPAVAGPDRTRASAAEKSAPTLMMVGTWVRRIR